MTWKDSFAIGVPEIDKQHRELCDQVDKLFEACARGKAIDEVLALLSFLEDYTVRHFRDEEAFQLKINYPRYEEHKAKHSDFVAKVEKMKNEATANVVTIKTVTKLNQIICDWLDDHLRGTDSDLKNYV